MTKHYIVIFLLITVISSLALAIKPINRRRRECLARIVPKLFKYPLNNTYCDYMRSCNVPCDKSLIPPTDIQLFDPSSMPIERRTAFTNNNNNNCLRPISFLRTTNSKSCDELAYCPNVRCVGKTKRDTDFKRVAYMAFEAFACVSSVVLMAAIEIGTSGWSTPALVTPVLGGACGSFKSVSDFIDTIGELFSWW